MRRCGFWEGLIWPERGSKTPLSGNHQAENDEPQPQVVTALGLRMTNWAPSSPSECWEASRSTAAREVAHACELDINRLQQQITFDGGQADSLSARVRVVEQELDVHHAILSVARATRTSARCRR